MAKQRQAVAAQVDLAVDSGYGWCRANQHIWKNPSKNRVELFDSGRLVKVAYRCPNCTGERHDTISLKTGELVSRYYVMPEHYVLKNVGPAKQRPSKSDWRKAHFSNLVRDL